MKGIVSPLNRLLLSVMLSPTKSPPPPLFFLFLFRTLAAAAAAASAAFPSAALPTSSGYLPVNATSDSAIYYAFYEAQQPLSPLPQTPLLVWLQGGPGTSSLIGNFLELGPWVLSTSNLSHPTLSPNPGSWNRLFGLLFLDNPIGTGFSFAASPDEIPTDLAAIAAHLFAAITSFLDKNPSFGSRPLYITGESYAGKYVPAIGSYILEQNSRRPTTSRINLQGVAIGNGLTDPATQVTTHANTAFYYGLINQKQRAELEKLQGLAVKLVEEERWVEATDARDRMLDWLQNATGLAALYDLRRYGQPELDLVAVLLQGEEVKRALGAKEGMVWEMRRAVVRKALYGDIMKSARFMLEELVRKSRVLLYQGQFDLLFGVVSTEALVEKMEWEGLNEFREAERRVWKVKGVVGGYVQKWGSLTHAVVAGAGHLAPHDQSLSSQYMIEDWVLQRGDFAGEELHFRGCL